MQTILVIDDEQDIIDMLSRQFLLENIKVVGANNGAQALKLMEENLFNVVISDIRLPDIDGKELLPKLKEINVLTNVVMITGYSSMDNVIGCLGGGAVDYFTKPINVDLLIKIVKDLFSKIERWKKSVVLAKK